MTRVYKFGEQNKKQDFNTRVFQEDKVFFTDITFLFAYKAGGNVKV